MKPVVGSIQFFLDHDWHFQLALYKPSLNLIDVKKIEVSLNVFYFHGNDKPKKRKTMNFV